MYIVRSALKSETSFNLCFKVGFWGQNRLVAATVHCKCLQGFTGEIGVRGFQIYGDCMYTRNPCNF